MTERWQQELRKLRSVDAPVELRERVDRGPTGDGLPPTRQRVLAGIVAFAVFAGAGAFAWSALSPRPPVSGSVDGAPALLVTLGAEDGSPSTVRYLSIERELLGLRLGMHGLFRPEVFPTAIPAGTPLLVHSDQTPMVVQVDRCLGWNDCSNERPDVPVSDRDASELLATPGIYILELTETGPGDPSAATRFWRLQLQIVPSDVPVVTFMRDRSSDFVPTGLVLWNASIASLEPGGDPRMPLGPKYVGPEDPLDFLTVPVGTTIAVAGTAERIQAVLGGTEPPFEPIESLAIEEGTFALHLIGRFVLAFTASWDLESRVSAEAILYLPVNVLPAQTPLPSIVPSPASPRGASDVLRLDCAADPVVTTPVVNARRAGIAVEWTPASEDAVWEFTPAGGGTPLQVTQFDAGGSSSPVWLPLQPGTWEVGCGRRKAELEVVDPDGLWTPYELACPSGDGSVELRASGPEGVSYPDAQAAIRALLSLQPADEVRAPGYPDMARDLSLPVDLRVVRNGRVVAELGLWPRSQGEPEGTAGFTKVEGTACSSSGIAAGS